MEANTRLANACPAKAMGVEQRQRLAIDALSGTCTITSLAEQGEVSRKFVYQQAAVAQEALDQAFAPAPTGDDEVLFQLPVTKRWLRGTALSLLLTCRSSFRGVDEFFRDRLDCSLSLGSIHNLLHNVIGLADWHNKRQPFDLIRNAPLTEIFQT